MAGAGTGINSYEVMPVSPEQRKVLEIVTAACFVKAIELTVDNLVPRFGSWLFGLMSP